jgi:NDP-sugar pyrophosphorylase family protein
MLPIAILAGGLATRLRPVTETVPKALIEVAGEPFLAHQLRLLRTHGFERVVLLVGYLGDTFAVIYGDSYLPCDYGAALGVFADSGKAGLMSVFRNEGLWDTSNVEFAAGRILAYDKANRTPAMRHIDYGLGAFRRAAFDAVPADCPSDLAVVYQDLLRRGELAAWESPERFYEIGSVEGIADLEEFLKS